MNIIESANEKGYRVSKVYSGHMYRNSPYETSSDCGNCDGARCDDCKELYEVTDMKNFDIVCIVSDKNEILKKIEKYENINN